MYSASGKFVSSRSNYNDDIQEIAKKIPEVPSSSEDKFSSFVKKYLGELWWLWIIVLILKFYKK